VRLFCCPVFVCLVLHLLQLRPCRSMLPLKSEALKNLHHLAHGCSMQSKCVSPQVTRAPTIRPFLIYVSRCFKAYTT
jgi:hypothetical protein